MYLVLFPLPEMLWPDWKTAAGAVDWFLDQYEAVALEFDILVLGENVGRGVLTDFR